jgi:hypothetical protein
MVLYYLISEHNANTLKPVVLSLLLERFTNLLQGEKTPRETDLGVPGAGFRV